MHPQRAALLILGHSLDHRAENVRVDLGPVEAADMAEVALRDLGKAGSLGAAGKQPAVDIGEGIGPAGQFCACAVRNGGVHRAEDFTDDLMRVRSIAVRHLVDGRGEQVTAGENIGVFGEEAKDQPRHEVVHVMAARGGAPVGVVRDQLDIEPVEAAGRADIKGAFADLLDGADAR